MRRKLCIAVVVPALLLVVAACGSTKGSDIATANGKGVAPSGAASLSPEERQERALKFVECMREQGIDMPDPEAGELHMNVNAANEDKTKAATEACRQYMPTGGDLQTPSTENVEALRKLAVCMREHGIDKFPDPGADGTVNLGGTGIDPGSAGFKAADQACKDLQPKAGS